MPSIEQSLERIRSVRHYLRSFVRRSPRQESEVEKRHARQLQQAGNDRQRVAEELQQERERRLRAESELKRMRDAGADARRAQERPTSLPEPDDSITKLRVFRTLLPYLKPGRMLDLGTGKGNFSLVAARLGWKVTAVDARDVRWPDPEAEKSPKRRELIRSVSWVQADVREFPVGDGGYDFICILGLLHRLEVKDQVALLERCSGALTLLDTRIAPEIADTESLYEGKYYHQGGETREEQDLIPQAAWGNRYGFRHTEDSLLRLVQDCGYSKMMFMRPPHREDYTMYLCLPAPEKSPEG